MRIAHFLKGRCNPDSANGVEKTVYALSRTQAALGHAVALFSVSEKPPLPIEGVEVRTYPPPWQPFGLPQRLWKDLRAWRPMLVHLHSAYVPANVALARRLTRTGTSYVVTPNGALAGGVLRRRRYVKVPYRILCELPLLNRAAFVHAVGDQDAIREYGVTVPIVVAPNGVDVRAIPANLVPGAVERRWPAAAGRRVVLFLGRLDVEQKGLDLLLRGFHQAGLRESGWVLVLAGPDWNGGRRHLEHLARQLGIDGHVCFWGSAFGREKFELFAAADLVACVSRWEGLPFSLVEALASARPCLVTRNADPIQLVERAGAGRVVGADPRGVAAALRELTALDRPALRALGLNGRKLVGRELNCTAIARTIVDGYRRYCCAEPEPV